jgi:trk system potassium uptake protein TrkH
MKAESPGPDITKIVPRVRTTALILYAIYFVLTLISFILYLVADMPCFDALNTAFATAGTGGFGFKNDSFAGMTATQQWLVTAFMLIFSVNFNSYYLLLKLKIRDAFNVEVRAFITIVICSIAIISFSICQNMDAIGQFDSIKDGVRHAAFTFAALISTTGFATVDFDIWPSLAKAVLLFAIFVGACAGSTGGGVKVSRILILLKGVGNEMAKLTHPRQVKPVTIDKKPVDNEVVRSVNSYIVAYLCIFAASIMLVSIEGKDMITTVTSVMTTLGNVGPGLSLVGPTANFAHMTDFSKLVLTFDMIAGRLELFPMLILFSPSTWKKS